MSKQRRHHSTLRSALILFLLLTCLAVVTLAWGMQRLPRLAMKEFGPASASLSQSQRLVYSARLFLYRQDLLNPADPDGAAQPFEIGLGETASSIAAKLQRRGLIRDAAAFRAYMIYSGLDRSIQAGEYEISPAMNAMQVAQSLQDATPRVINFQILPGWRLEEIAAALPTSGLVVTPEQFLLAARRPDADLLPSSLQGLDRLEGFLFPGAYRLERDLPVEALLAAFLQRFDEQVTPEMRKAYQRHGLSLEEAVVLASIVEREAVVDAEAPAIAAVFFNRLDQGMKLDSDPTVQYALGFNHAQNSWWTNPLRAEDMAFDSPYNTYIYRGLPPSPIANPGLAALEAVAYPQQSSYYYFRARCDGSGRHNFSVTYEEHLQKACP